MLSIVGRIGVIAVLAHDLDGDAEDGWLRIGNGAIEIKEHHRVLVQRARSPRHAI